MTHTARFALISSSCIGRLAAPQRRPRRPCSAVLRVLHGAHACVGGLHQPWLVPRYRASMCVCRNRTHAVQCVGRRQTTPSRPAPRPQDVCRAAANSHRAARAAGAVRPSCSISAACAASDSITERGSGSMHAACGSARPGAEEQRCGLDNSARGRQVAGKRADVPGVPGVQPCRRAAVLPCRRRSEPYPSPQCSCDRPTCGDSLLPALSRRRWRYPAYTPKLDRSCRRGRRSADLPLTCARLLLEYGPAVDSVSVPAV